MFDSEGILSNALYCVSALDAGRWGSPEPPTDG
jgi:hypothetical protein